jgi:hypothetical protein
MPVHFRFGIGPVRFSYRLSKTQAQKRAAARQRDARKAARADRKFDPREHITVTENATSVEITVDARGLSPAQGEQVTDLAEKLRAKYSGVPSLTAAEKAAIERAHKTHARQIAEIVAMTDERAQADALAAIQDPALQTAAIEAVLQDAADHAGDPRYSLQEPPGTLQAPPPRRLLP